MLETEVMGARTGGRTGGPGRRRAFAWVALVWLGVCTEVAAQPAVPVPSRSRARHSGADAGLVESSRGLRQTVRFYRKWFKRQGIDVREIPIYAYRRVTIARFLARNPRTSWLAVHVFRHQGRTFIRIVERAHKAP